MSIRRMTITHLRCDMPRCRAVCTWVCYLSRAAAERAAREKSGWRKDKLGRNVCPAHPKLKGAKA